jgi:hypothetical protein
MFTDRKGEGDVLLIFSKIRDQKKGEFMKFVDELQ